MHILIRTFLLDIRFSGDTNVFKDHIADSFGKTVTHFKGKSKGGNRQKSSGPGCSNLTTSLVNVLLKFQMLIFETCQYFCVEKM